MAPKEAGVFVVEDDPRKIEEISETLEKSGHRVVATATSVEQALQLIPQLESLGVQVAIIDGYLEEGTNKDGTRVAVAIRKKIPSIKIVALSTMPTDTNPADERLRKDDIQEWLGKIVTRL